MRTPNTARPNRGPRTLENQGGADEGFWFSPLLEPVFLLCGRCNAGVLRPDSIMRLSSGLCLHSFTDLVWKRVCQSSTIGGSSKSPAKDDIHVSPVNLDLVWGGDPRLKLQNFLAEVEAAITAKATGDCRHDGGR